MPRVATNARVPPTPSMSPSLIITLLLSVFLLELLVFLPAVHCSNYNVSQQAAAAAELERKPITCSIFKDLGVNDLSINDVVVKGTSTNVACIKARFSLAIKVETDYENVRPSESAANGIHSDESQKMTSTKTPAALHTTANPRSASEGSEEHPNRITLGYLPLDSVIAVEDNCPQPKPPSPPPTPSGGQEDGVSPAAKNSTEDEMNMTVTFECGMFSFTFKKGEHYYISSLKGLVNLDPSTIREFVAERPMFVTSDLQHHFKFPNLIEVNSMAKPKTFILTANFYNLEYEAFRTTTSRDFVRPPDTNSKPFPKR